MARIASVKPELFTSTTLGRCCLHARYLFIGLLTQADHYGKLLDSPKLLAGAIFPHDDDATPEAVDKWLSDLENVGCIERYTVEGGHPGGYLSFPNWEDHQQVSHPGIPRIPNKDGSLPTNFPKVAGNILEMFPEVSPAPPGGRRQVTRSAVERDFDEAWKIYPRKIARKSALNAYAATRHRGEGAAQLLAATKRYAALRRTEDPAFTLHGSTFFGPSERWKDYLEDVPERPDPNDGPSWGNLSRDM
jgi:hypothetical protein